MKIRYFAWVRDHTGCAEEELGLPAELESVADLARYLAGRSDGHAKAFADLKKVRVAIDQQFAGPDASIKGASEIAFFPPVTGG